MTRQEALERAIELRRTLGRKPALEFIRDYKFISGLQWSEKQMASIRALKDAPSKTDTGPQE